MTHRYTKLPHPCPDKAFQTGPRAHLTFQYIAAPPHLRAWLWEGPLYPTGGK